MRIRGFARAKTPRTIILFVKTQQYSALLTVHANLHLRPTLSASLFPFPKPPSPASSSSLPKASCPPQTLPGPSPYSARVVGCTDARPVSRFDDTCPSRSDGFSPVLKKVHLPLYLHFSTPRSRWTVWQSLSLAVVLQSKQWWRQGRSDASKMGKAGSHRC